jgi:peptide/nickel transport system substrate-binding protein
MAGIRSSIGRRGFTSGALGAGLVFGTGRAPALAQGQRDLRVGLFGGEFGNLSPLLRLDIQGGTIAYNIFDSLVEIDIERRTIVPLVAEAWTNPDPLTWRIKLREGVKWQKGYGEVTAEDLAYTWNFHLESKLPGRNGAVPRRYGEGGRQVRGRVKTRTPFGAFPRRHHGL